MILYFTYISRDSLKSFSFVSDFEIKIRKLAVVVHVLQTTQNVVISRCCFTEADGKEMYQELQLTCTTIFLLITPFV